MGGDGVESKTPANTVVAEIAALGGSAVADYADARSAVDVQAMVERAIERWGQVDIAICNAGNIRKLKFSETKVADLESHLSTHVIGSFLLAKAVWPQMVRRGYGRIIMTTSQVGLYGQLDAAAYGASKMAIIGLMHAMKLEAEGTGIVINCISPFAATRMASGTFSDKLSSLIDPACVAPAIAYLASRECALQGRVLIAGGGHFAMAETIESKGLDVDDPLRISPEQLRDQMRAISDFSTFEAFPDALTAVQKTFDRLSAK